MFPEEQKISAVQVHTPLDEPSAAQLPLDEKYEVEVIIQKKHTPLARTQQPKPQPTENLRIIDKYHESVFSLGHLSNLEKKEDVGFFFFDKPNNLRLA